MEENKEKIRCQMCDRFLNSWDLRISKVLAYQAPACECCIAKEYGMEQAELRGRMETFFGMRPCMGI